MLDSRRDAVAVITMHASPLSELGRGDNGGMNLAVRRLCEGLSDRGIPSDVFVRRESTSAPDEELIAPHSRLVRLSAGPARSLHKAAVAELCDEFTDALLAHARSEQRRYRLVHGHYWLSGVVAEASRAAWDIPWVQSFHTLARTKARAGLPLELPRAEVEARLVRAADRLVAASVSEAKDLIRLYGASRDRICVAQPGVDQRLFQPRDTGRLRARLGLEGRRVVLFAGRLEPLKGADTLLAAVEALGDMPGFDDVTVLVVGDESGENSAQVGERERLEERARTARLSGRVRFLGAVPHEELAGYYSLADVCVVPSRTESFGLVALEAQSLGTPVVAAAVGGLTEIVEDGVTGTLVDGRDPLRWAGAIAGVLRDPGRRAEIGEAAKVRSARFTWTRAVDRLEAIYDRLTTPRLDTDTPCGYDEDDVRTLRAS